MVVIEMENGGVIKIELNREAAPKTVENFEKLVSSGFYDVVRLSDEPENGRDLCDERISAQYGDR